MSESIPMTKRAPRASKSRLRNSKWFNPLLTAMVPAIVTIAVSFIAIVPELRRGDAQSIAELNQKLSLKEQQSNTAMNIPVSSDKKLSVSGTVRSEDGRGTLSEVEVYLIPLSTSPMIAKTNKSGWFTFKQIPVGTYQILVREPTLGKSGIGLLLPDQPEGEVPVKGAKVTYQIEK